MNDIPSSAEPQVDQAGDGLDARERGVRRRPANGGYTLVCDFSVSPYDEPELFDAMQALSMARLLDWIERNRPDPANS